MISLYIYMYMQCVDCFFRKIRAYIIHSKNKGCPEIRRYTRYAVFRMVLSHMFGVSFCRVRPRFLGLPRTSPPSYTTKLQKPGHLSGDTVSQSEHYTYSFPVKKKTVPFTTQLAWKLFFIRLVSYIHPIFHHQHLATGNQKKSTDSDRSDHLLIFWQI